MIRYETLFKFLVHIFSTAQIRIISLAVKRLSTTANCISLTLFVTAPWKTKLTNKNKQWMIIEGLGWVIGPMSFFIDHPNKNSISYVDRTQIWDDSLHKKQTNCFVRTNLLLWSLCPRCKILKFMNHHLYPDFSKKETFSSPDLK